MSLEFLKVYNVTKLIKEERENLFSYEDVGYTEVYISMDVRDAHVFRIIEGYNNEFEKEEGIYLVEREMISKIDIAEKLLELDGHYKMVSSKIEADEIIKRHSRRKVALATLLLDNDNGLENYEAEECFSLEEAREMVEGGYGIAVL